MHDMELSGILFCYFQLENGQITGNINDKKGMHSTLFFGVSDDAVYVPC